MIYTKSNLKQAGKMLNLKQAREQLDNFKKFCRWFRDNRYTGKHEMRWYDLNWNINYVDNMLIFLENKETGLTPYEDYWLNWYMKMLNEDITWLETRYNNAYARLKTKWEQQLI